MGANLKTFWLCHGWTIVNKLELLINQWHFTWMTNISNFKTTQPPSKRILLNTPKYNLFTRQLLNYHTCFEITNAKWWNLIKWNIHRPKHLIWWKFHKQLFILCNHTPVCSIWLQILKRVKSSIIMQANSKTFTLINSVHQCK